MLRSDWNGWEKDLRFAGFYESIKEHDLGDPEQRLHKISDRGQVGSDGQLVPTPGLDELTSRVRGFRESHPDCTAIMCSGDELALMVLLSLNRLGVKVPQDMSVVGYGNIEALTYSQPALSTIAMPVGKMMHDAFDLLMNSIDKNDDKPEKVVIPTELIVRQSTGPARE